MPPCPPCSIDQCILFGRRGTLVGRGDRIRLSEPIFDAAARTSESQRSCCYNGIDDDGIERAWFITVTQRSRSGVAWLLAGVFTLAGSHKLGSSCLGSTWCADTGDRSSWLVGVGWAYGRFLMSVMDVVLLRSWRDPLATRRRHATHRIAVVRFRHRQRPSTGGLGFRLC